MHFQNRFKDLIGLGNGNFGWRDNGHFTFDALVDDEVFTAQFTDKFDQDVDVDIIKVDRNKLFAVLCALRAGELPGCWP